MADSVTVGNLPSGYDAYAGYVDGLYVTFPALQAKFPGVPLLSIAVFSTDQAECLDVENGDADAAEVPGWVQAQQARGITSPVIYSSVLAQTSSTGNYGMPEVLAALSAAGIPRSAVRLWSAHYGAGEHICGPDTCNLISIPMDGTQWTDTAAGVNGTQIDASLLSAGFFEENTMITVPGWQGTWLSVIGPVVGANGHQILFGLGTDGNWWQVIDVNGTQTGPVQL
jgi:hypothetical protein